jgi:hypothetical protein
MADDGLTLDIDTSELIELVRQFPEYQDIVTDKARIAMISSLKKFQELIKGKTPVGVSGDLRKSFTTSRRVRRGENVFTGSVTSSEPHAFPIELGRKPGQPISRTGKESIALWIKRTWNPTPPENQIKGLAFVVARSITRKGFKKKKGYRMVEQAFKEGTPIANKAFDLATQEATKEIDRKISQIE